MPVRKMSGVINNGDGGNNEMSYVDMHDLHPVNVSSAVVNAATEGAISGAVLAAVPAGIVAVGLNNAKNIAGDAAEEFLDVPVNTKSATSQLNPRNLKIAGAILATGAVVMGAVKAFTAKGKAETHNAWSEKVLSRMEENEKAGHATAVTEQRTKDAQAALQKA